MLCFLADSIPLKSRKYYELWYKHLRKSINDLKKQIELNRVINMRYWNRIFRSSTRTFSVKMVFIKIFQIRKKATVSESLINKVAGLEPASFVINTFRHWCSLVTLTKFSRTHFFRSTSEWLLLNFCLCSSKLSISGTYLLVYVSVDDKSKIKRIV